MTTKMFRRGFKLLDRGMDAAASESVLYTRGARVISEELPAHLDLAIVEQITEGGAAVIGRQFTWHLKRDALRLDNKPTDPKTHDKIEWRHDGATYVFEVMPELGGAAMPGAHPQRGWLRASVKLIERR